MSDFDETEMTGDEKANVETVEATAPTTSRVFKVGGTTIHEDASTTALTSEQARGVLQAAYPEIANATIRETTANGVLTVEFLPQAGRKG